MGLAIESRPPVPIRYVNYLINIGDEALAATVGGRLESDPRSVGEGGEVLRELARAAICGKGSSRWIGTSLEAMELSPAPAGNVGGRLDEFDVIDYADNFTDVCG
jgi:hypothetical protein